MESTIYWIYLIDHCGCIGRVCYEGKKGTTITTVFDATANAVAISITTVFDATANVTLICLIILYYS